MWQYTSETIINSNEGKFLPANETTPVRFAIIDKDGKKVTTGFDADVHNKLVIDGVVCLDTADIKAMYRTPYMPAENAQAEITISAEEGAVLRLRVRLTEIGNSRSIMQNAYLHKSKPFTYEIISTDDAEKNAAAFAKLIKKDLAETDFKLFSVAVDGAKLTVTAADPYIRFADFGGLALSKGQEGGLELLKIATPAGTGLTGIEDAESLGFGTVLVTGNQGAGTVARIIKDLRIPTSATSDPFELKDGGMPIPGGKYDQYLIEVETKRRHIAGGVVGSINESLTSFVFFIESAAKSDWKAMLDLFNEVEVEKAGIKNDEGDVVNKNIATNATTGDLELIDKTPKSVGNIG